MKSLWNSFKIAFAMFSKIPMPQAEWTEENMRYMLCFFPFVGAAAGLLTLGVSWLGEYFGFGTGFMAMALILVPVLVTGGIHVDGLLDTSDALSSWRDREKRLEILKDSHAGAFAVITACVYFLVLYGGFSQITGDWTAMKLIALGYVVSRCFSGLGVITLPKANASEMADILVENGVPAIWNFAHTDLHLPEHVIVENVHLSESLMQLSYNLNRYNQQHKK